MRKQNTFRSPQLKERNWCFHPTERYFYGKKGLKEDISQGIAWLKEAGMAGYEKAQKKLIDIIPDNYLNDSDIIHWLFVYDRSRYDRLCAIHQMMM